MARYIRAPVVISPITLLRRAYDFLQARMPGWTPSEGQLDVWLLEAVSSETSELITMHSQVQDTIFKFFGRSLINLPPITAAAATATTTWTMRDTAGHTIPAGTQLTITDPATGNKIPFKTIASVVVPVGVLSTGAGAVAIVAVNPSSDANGINGAVEPQDILDFVSSVALVALPSGGIDEENDADYFNRLVDWNRTNTRTPILADDFALLAIGIGATFRAVALDGYNPATDTFGNERYVTVAGIDVNGNAVSAGDKTLIQNTLDALREANFVVGTISPTYSVIDVETTVKASNGYATNDVEASVIQALTNLLSPQNWGFTANIIDGGTDPHEWVNKSVLYKYEVSKAINNVAGVEYITTPVKTGIHGNALYEQDLTLPGRVPLPRPGTMLITAI